MEATFVRTVSKSVRQRLGTYMLDLKYKPETVICVEKVGVDDFAAVICSAEFLRQNGIDLPEKGKSEPETKPEPKKKK